MMDPIKLTLAVANFGVALLNAIACTSSKELRDLLAALAWFGSGSYWFWQALS